MMRANRASYKTCFVFRLDDHDVQKSEYLDHNGAWIPLSNNMELLVKCFEEESANAVVDLIRTEYKRKFPKANITIVAEETECDIIHELQLYSFVNQITIDLAKATARM